ncbi:hypothetical protein M1247_12820 [Mycobacterium sp. 21AC1]|uniref:hypothetical protein n=1 Tax=[Mycobacterium] appelbergii TaxID=2939269 RepID=UPI0029391C00|nr:hypothetical protein [Mycobacterium sp. 21AC1]MDV3125803.1 hypothetical protein [Mycobacterium sp. 21AC1]
MPDLVNPGGIARSPALPKASVEQVDALKAVVRTTLGLTIDTTVLVQQLACAEPDCPPVETVIAVLSSRRTTWKLARPTADIAVADLRRVITEHPEGHDHADHH